MEKIGAFIEKWRKIIIIFVAIITLFMLYGFKFIKIESDIARWIRQDVPEIKSMNYISEKFGGEDIALVAVKSDSLFTFRGLKLIAELHDSFEGIKGVFNVTSLINILDIRGTSSGIDIRNLIDKYNIPESPDSIIHLKKYILSKDIYRGRLVSSDGEVILFIIRLSKSVNKPAVATKIRNIALRIIDKEGRSFGLYFSGSPLLLKTINSTILKDMLKLIPLVVFVVLVVLYYGLGSFIGVLLTIITVLMASIWSIGLMAYLGVPLSVISNVMPVLLIAVGSAYGIHILSRYYRWLGSGMAKVESVKKALSEVFIPIVLAALTTMASFFSFAGSYVVTIGQFGIFTGIGIGFALLLSLLFIPSVLMGAKYRVRHSITSQGGNAVYKKLADFVGGFVIKYRGLIVCFGVVILFVGGVGFSKLRTSSNLLYYFSKKNEVRKSAEFLREYFKGDIPVNILVKGDLKEPWVLQKMLDFEKYMRTREDVGFPNSFADLIANMNNAAFGYYAIPETRAQIEDLAFMIEGRPIIKQLVTENYDEGVISANTLMSAYGPLKKYFEDDFKSAVSEVNVDTVKDKKIVSYIISRALLRIIWDFQYRGIVVNKKALNNILQTGFYGQNKGFFLGEKDSMKSKIMAYFNDEEIPVDNAVLTRLVSLLLNRANDSKSLKVFLTECIPLDIQEEDKSIVDDINTGLLNIMYDFMLKKRILSIETEIWKLANSKITDDLKKDIEGDLYTMFKKEQYIPSSLVGQKGRAFTALYSGLLPVEEKINKNLIKSQIKSMIIALFVVLILVSFDLVSLLGGVTAALPIFIVIAINFGLMGFFRINLDSGTMLVASIAIGIGIDYAIHFLSHLKHELKDGIDIEEGVKRTITEKGRAILTNAISVGCGFLVLAFGELIPIRNFGWLLFITMITSSLFSLTFLPSLIILFKKHFYRILRKGGR